MAVQCRIGARDNNVLVPGLAGCHGLHPVQQEPSLSQQIKLCYSSAAMCTPEHGHERHRLGGIKVNSAPT